VSADSTPVHYALLMIVFWTTLVLVLTKRDERRARSAEAEAVDDEGASSPFKEGDGKSII
jgi:hypothetical protein